jgi:hypothetical protein
VGLRRKRVLVLGGGGAGPSSAQRAAPGAPDVCNLQAKLGEGRVARLRFIKSRAGPLPVSGAGSSDRCHHNDADFLICKPDKCESRDFRLSAVPGFATTCGCIRSERVETG